MNTLKKAVFIISVSILMSACQAKTSEPCKNLGKVNNIDDWLYQVHSNINSQCLFEMPVSELERIWGLPIIDKTVPNTLGDKQVAINMKRMAEAKTFYIIKKYYTNNHKQIVFQIAPSQTYWQQNHHTFGGSFLEGVFPKRLPQFDIYRKANVKIRIPYDYDANRAFYDNHPSLLNKQNQYQSYHDYYWMNSARNRNMPSLEIKTFFIPTPEMVIFSNHSTHKYDYYADIILNKIDEGVRYLFY